MMRRVRLEDLPTLRLSPIDNDTLEQSRSIVERVRDGGDAALRKFAEVFGDIEEGARMVIEPSRCKEAFDSLPPDARQTLQRAAERIRTFAEAQRTCLTDLRIETPEGVMGHKVLPIERAGCYAPGGRYPLPSSVLMTAVTARAAGVEEVLVASPRPTLETLAAAYVSGCDRMLCVGGAQVIAALAFGTDSIPSCGVIVGPGNRWVTAAKQLVSGVVAIDMLAGPSELLVLADETANPEWVAADLLAQAEHDPDAIPMLASTSSQLLDQVERFIQQQLADLPTRTIAEASLRNGLAVTVLNRDDLIASANRLGPEHLQIHAELTTEQQSRLDNYGAIFASPSSAEVFGDYGMGPNHTLPTGGTSRSFGGLSVFNFLRVVTSIEAVNLESGLIADTAKLARMERLEGHARAAEVRNRT
ncbi:MAG TPA: histidinol dehydrogenase [Fimbriimonadaceae bacterium]|nr:histidinol dehydrogenase [Fimbriimonadaceae bacterium]